MSSPHIVLLAYSVGLIHAWSCICSDYIQLTYFSISSETISSGIVFLFTFYLEVYPVLFLFLLLILLFLVILGIISHIFELFFCLIMIIPRYYPKFTLRFYLWYAFSINPSKSMQTFSLFNSTRTVSSLCIPCRLHCIFHNPSTRSRLTKQVFVKFCSAELY